MTADHQGAVGDARKRAQEAASVQISGTGQPNTPDPHPNDTAVVSGPQIAAHVVARDLDLDAIRARAEAATPGPWGYHESSKAWRCWSVWGVRPDENIGDGEVHIGDIRGEVSEANAEFIAHARTDIPALLAALDEARAENEHWRSMHDDATAQLRLSINETTEARAKCAGLSDLAGDHSARAAALEATLATARAEHTRDRKRLAKVEEWLRSESPMHDARQTEGYWRAQSDLRAALATASEEAS